MWLPQKIVDEVNEVARIHYVDKASTQRWNQHRREGELRLLTGWCWQAKQGSRHQQGLKTLTAAYRDAWYALIAKAETPSVTRPRLRLVARRVA